MLENIYIQMNINKEEIIEEFNILTKDYYKEQMFCIKQKYIDNLKLKTELKIFQNVFIIDKNLIIDNFYKIPIGDFLIDKIDEICIYILTLEENHNINFIDMTEQFIDNTIKLSYINIGKKFIKSYFNNDKNIISIGAGLYNIPLEMNKAIYDILLPKNLNIKLKNSLIFEPISTYCGMYIKTNSNKQLYSCKLCKGNKKNCLLCRLI